MRSPSVTVKEEDLTQRVPATSTVTGGMVVCSRKGPVNESRLISRIDDYINLFGEPNSNQLIYNSYFTAEGYLEWGNQLWVTRVDGDDAQSATLTLGSDTDNEVEISYENKIVPDDYPLEESDMDDTSIDTEILYVTGNGTGSYYNDISVAVVNSTDYGRLDNLNTALTKTKNYAHKKATCEQYYTGTTDPITADGLVFKVGSFDGDSSNYAGSISPTGDLSDSDLRKDVIDYDEQEEEYAPNMTTLGGYIGFERGPDDEKEFGFYVFDRKGNLSEMYFCSSDPEAVDYRNKKIFAPDVVNDTSDYVQIFVDGGENANVSPLSLCRTHLGELSSTDNTSATVNESEDGKGEDGTVDESGDPVEPTGNILDQFNEQYGKPESLEIDLLIDVDYSDTVKREIDQIAQQRMDAYGILSMPKSYIDAGVEDMVNYINDTLNIDSSYASIYGQYFKIYDRHNDVYRWAPVAGYMAGIYAYNDEKSNVWMAPAGMNRGIVSGISEVAIDPDKTDRDYLYSNRINTIVDFPRRGIVVWGQKTLQSQASAFDRVNVRRLFIMVEDAISELADEFLFENNNKTTRSLFSSSVGSYLSRLKGQGAMYDYKVVCDESNNTPEVIDNNEMVCDIYIKPARAVEYITLEFIATPTGVSFSEVVGE